MSNAIADWPSVIRKHGLTHTLDVGANIGGMVHLWLEHGAKRVLAVEPVPECFAEIVRKYGQDPRVVPLQLGVSDIAHTKADLNIHNCWTLASEDPSHGIARSIEFVGKPPFSVEFKTIDQILLEHSFEPTFIKIDVDGYECRAMRGARAYLASHRPLVMLEVSYLPDLLGDCNECMIREILSNGYVIRSIVDGKTYKTVKDFMRVFPWDTSIDVFLVPS